MSVLIPNTQLGVRVRAEGGRDAHGSRLPAGWGPLTPLFPGLVKEDAQGQCVLGLDPALWPVRVDDLVVSSAGAGFLVKSADLLQNAFDSTVDWVRVTALPRTPTGTSPGGAWMVARYTPAVGPGVGTPADLLSGEGPPPDDLDVPAGTEYLDTLTGTVWRLGGPPGPGDEAGHALVYTAPDGPDEVPPGVEPGDEYLNTTSGDMYTLGED